MSLWLRVLLTVALLEHLEVPVNAQDKRKPAPPDHGRVLATCIEVAPGKLKDTTRLSDTKNYVFRGRVISLGKDRRVSICYDTEHMRVAGIWVGKPMAYAADKSMGPSVDGGMICATKPGPGWAKDGKWDDPRKGNEGPLPHDWAHYRGLYLHGDQVVMSYTVGDIAILEMPEVSELNGATIISRTLNVGPTSTERQLLILEADESERISVSGNRATIGAADKKPRTVTLTGLTGCKLEAVGQRLITHLPPSAKPVKYQIAIATDGQAIQPVPEAKLEDLAPRTKGGPPRWTQSFETECYLGTDQGSYALDLIDLPEKNPWNASIRFGGLDFFPDGRAALCTWDGDVWIVSGLNDKVAKVRWKRFAAGLQQTLGLKIINGIIHTAGRDQITRLHDLNNDGEADYFENFNNDAGLTLQRHEYVMDLQTDKAGNLYFCRSGHYIQSKRGDNCCVYKLSPDGLKLERFAHGFREPNGMGIGPDGTMTVGDNEGNGIPQTPLYHLKQGADYGFTPSQSGKVDDGTWTLREKPIVWLGPKIDSSNGGQVWAPNTWGPLGGQLLHTSYGNCALLTVLIDKQAEPWQGAVWKFPMTFTSGIMRARFSPADGQLYVCGLRGWGTSAVKDGQFARVRYTGKPTPIPVGYRVHKQGIDVKFSEPLDKATAEDADNFAGEWTVVLKKTRGAKEKEEMPITETRLAPDGKTITVVLEKTQPVTNFTLQYRVKAANGTTATSEIHGTIHRVP